MDGGVREPDVTSPGTTRATARKVVRVLLLALVFACIGYIVLGLGSPGPHENPMIGWIVLGVIALSVLTLIGGLRWLLLSLAAAVGAAGILFVALNLRLPVERPLAYWVIDEQTLGVVVGDAVDTGCHVVVVDESSDTVRLRAQCWERVLPVPGPAMLEAHVIQVTLQAPLGSRMVHDGADNVAEPCPGPWPDCPIPG
jgi:hypothetical protein